MANDPTDFAERVEQRLRDLDSRTISLAEQLADQAEEKLDLTRQLEQLRDQVEQLAGDRAESERLRAQLARSAPPDVAEPPTHEHTPDNRGECECGARRVWDGRQHVFVVDGPQS